MSIDMYGHGNSDDLGPDANFSTRATGMTDAVELIAALPYVDSSRIGVTGHSNGARAANLAVDDDNLKEKQLISAVLLVANDANYVDETRLTTINTVTAMLRLSLPDLMNFSSECQMLKVFDLHLENTSTRSPRSPS